MIDIVIFLDILDILSYRIFTQSQSGRNLWDPWRPSALL